MVEMVAGTDRVAAGRPEPASLGAWQCLICGYKSQLTGLPRSKNM